MFCIGDISESHVPDALHRKSGQTLDLTSRACQAIIPTLPDKVDVCVILTPILAPIMDSRTRKPDMWFSLRLSAAVGCSFTQTPCPTVYISK